MNIIEQFKTSPEVKSFNKKMSIFLSIFIILIVTGMIIISFSVFIRSVDFSMFLFGMVIIFISFIPLIFVLSITKNYDNFKQEFIKKNFSDEELGKLLFSLSSKPTDPDNLKWEKFGRVSKTAGNIERIRVKITADTVSSQLQQILLNTKYNFDNEPPEILGLITIIENLSESLDMEIFINRMTNETDLKGSFIKYLEPYKFLLPFQNTNINLSLSIFEIQWNLSVGKEDESSLREINRLKEHLLDYMKQYIRNGNRN